MGHLLRGDQSRYVPDIRIQPVRHAGNVHNRRAVSWRPSWKTKVTSAAVLGHSRNSFAILVWHEPGEEVPLVTRKHPGFSRSPWVTQPHTLWLLDSEQASGSDQGSAP